MDTGEGKFEYMPNIDEKTVEHIRDMFPKSKGIFSEGETIEIRGSLFKVKEITPFGIKLKLLKS